eukprot:SAG31_NODE_674_length_12909_cov_25.961124_2_plen_76_part_00
MKGIAIAGAARVYMPSSQVASIASYAITYPSNMLPKALFTTRSKFSSGNVERRKSFPGLCASNPINPTSAPISPN